MKILSLLIFILLAPPDDPPMSMEDSHKFYVSLTDMRYNEETDKVEVSMRLFIDDFTLALGIEDDREFGPEVDRYLFSPIGDYMRERFQVEIDQQPCEFEILGYEVENDVVWVHLESNVMFPPTNAFVRNSMLMDLYEDQQNIVHFEYGGKIQSVFLSKSNSAQAIQFN